VAHEVAELLHELIALDVRDVLALVVGVPHRRGVGRAVVRAPGDRGHTRGRKHDEGETANEATSRRALGHRADGTGAVSLSGVSAGAISSSNLSNAWVTESSRLGVTGTTTASGRTCARAIRRLSRASCDLRICQPSKRA